MLGRVLEPPNSVIEGFHGLAAVIGAEGGRDAQPVGGDVMSKARHSGAVRGVLIHIDREVQVWDTAALPLNDPVQADETPAAKKLYQRQPELMPFVVGLRAAKYGKGESHPETGELTLINRPEEGGITGTGLIRPAIDVAARGVWRRGGTGLGNAGSGDAVP
tara:strand:- start:787 stop:1272 length:486 start_codon:yes stop_codon:yes gene_type:complete